MAIRLSFSRDGLPEQRLRFDGARVSVGASPGNDLRLDGPGVAPVHLTFAREEGGWAASAAASGARLEGRPLQDERVLPGDSLRLGSFRLCVIDADCDEEAAVGAQGAEALGPAWRDPAAQSTQQRAASPAGTPRAAASREAPRRAAPRAHPLRARRALAPAVAVAASLGIGLWCLAVASAPTGLRSQPQDGDGEVTRVLEPRLASEVFGRGAGLGITIPAARRVRLSFAVPGEGRTGVHRVRFVARDLTREGALAVSLNGRPLGQVAPGLPGESRAHRLPLPRRALRKGENVLLFENADEGSWALGSIALERGPAPEGPADELAGRAAASFELAEQRLRHRDIAASNRYDAWVAFRRAQYFLDALEVDEALQAPAAQRLRELDQELEAVCRRILLAGKRHQELGRRELAIREYEHGLQWFPGDEHGCRERIEAQLAAVAPAAR